MVFMRFTPCFPSLWRRNRGNDKYTSILQQAVIAVLGIIPKSRGNFFAEFKKPLSFCEVLFKDGPRATSYHLSHLCSDYVICEWPLQKTIWIYNVLRYYTSFLQINNEVFCTILQYWFCTAYRVIIVLSCRPCFFISCNVLTGHIKCCSDKIWNRQFWQYNPVAICHTCMYSRNLF